MRAPAAAAVVVAVLVAPDDVVAAGDRLAVVEAMKMEVAITAPVAGRVRDVYVAANVQVEAGAALVRLEPLGGGRRHDGSGRTPRLRRRGHARTDDPAAVAAWSRSRPSPPTSRASTSTPHEAHGPARPLRAATASLLGGDRRRALPGRADRPVHLRRPLRAHPQPPRGIGRRRRRPQSPRALPHLPALARRRPRRPARGVPGRPRCGPSRTTDPPTSRFAPS